MSEDPFESAEFEAMWGSVKAMELKALRERFFAQENTCVRVTEFNSETGHYEVKIRILRTLPTEARGIAADGLRSFRNALDQAVFAATQVIRGKGNRQCHFPFGESPDDLENSLSRRLAPQCKGIPEELFPVLRACMPYPRGEGYTGGNDALKALGRASGPHKHQVTLRVNGAPQKTSIATNHVIDVGPGGGYLFFDGWDRAKNELKLFAYPPGGHFKTDIEVTMCIAFGPGPLENANAESFLLTLADDVTVIVARIKKAALALAGS